MKKHNFFAGPAVLPEIVKTKASQAALDYNNTGLSIMEISHRSNEFVAVLDNTEKYIRTILNLDDNYSVLLLTGGASTQFFMTAMNLANKNDSIGYVDTGAWSSKAIKEAKILSNVEILASSKDKNYNYIPYDYNIPESCAYVHLTSNNTIFGTQTKKWPDTDKFLVCDMSSDIFSRQIPLEKFGLIYAGAQKNAGPSGVTIVIVRKNILGKIERTLPTILKYQTHIDKKSSFNTPPVFPIYVSMLTMEWILEKGGIDEIAERNAIKAKTLYDEIDSNPLFVGTANKDDRSTMNVTFLINDPNLEQLFLDNCTKAGIVGIAGHRSVGGFRASIYNALEQESVDTLVGVMKEMAVKVG